MSKVVALRNTDNPRDVIHRAVQHLAHGELVAFPTETVYVVAAHALQPHAVQQLQEIFSAPCDRPPTLIVKGMEEALDYVPSMPVLGRKFTSRCWPGPVTIAFDVSMEDLGLLKKLPNVTREAVAPGGALSMRVPAHSFVREVLRLMPAPMVFSKEKSDGGTSFRSPQDIIEKCGDRLAMVIDDGDCRYGEASSIVNVTHNGWSVVQQGVVAEITLRRLAGEVYLFVCTGNTCRSPMAEALFRKLLAERLECTPDDLIELGYVVLSAGLAADIGAAASPETVVVMEQRGVDIRGHESRPVDQRLIDQADHIYTMTKQHREALLADRPELADKVELLARDENDIPDPIGLGLAEYVRCRDSIEREIRSLLSVLPCSQGRTNTP